MKYREKRLQQVIVSASAGPCTKPETRSRQRATNDGVADGYVSVERIFTANPDSSQTTFRGQDGFDSSGDAFVGNWLAAGVTKLPFWVRHFNVGRWKALSAERLTPPIG